MSDYITPNTEVQQLNIPPPPTWEWCLWGDWYGMTVSPPGNVRYPNFIHRLACRLILGIHCRRK